ncbi:cytochrome P450 family protein [Kitasatospora purpeofusca]|uniref:cytochrome P450 family protein n=1 Tax=Kitasatospora purpeofusca TaxID=67352 RepID=UPI0022526574|nr:cytochrome P450 [Kitasatospora purpeofusca]MCX4756236.1 cytochrome P450 [Kitasatospora purpeofusca]WSR35933.1 cytochrome P450 [Kitasatospora purpeofusca]WSR44242.1 cytochrome P450 [Kitasatospora purpeofusca]
MSTAVDDAAARMSAFIRDPYPTLARIREAGAVSVVEFGEGLPVYLVTRYEDVRAALMDPRFGQDVRRSQAIASGRGAGLTLGSDVVHMLNSDPPDHTRLRRLIQGVFTRRRVDLMRPLVERIAGGLLDGLRGRSTADLVTDFAFPLPIMVICELLGFPPEDMQSFRTWSTAILTQGGEMTFDQATGELNDYLRELMTTRRASPRTDILTDLVRACDAGELSEKEVFSMVFLLLIGGHETTVNLLGTATLALLHHPDQLAWLRANPAAMPVAIDEFLRYESPVSMATMRFTNAEVTVDDVEIPADELVLLSLGAANRDPARFTDPDRLVLDRNDPGHLAFGQGLHRCLGSFLGKLESEVALTGLLERFTRIELAAPEETLPWRNTIMLRGLESLPVSLDG